MRAEAQPTVGASTRVNTSRSIAAVMPTAPGASNERAPSRVSLTFGTSFSAPASVIAETATGTKKTQRQPSSVSAPPNTSPSEKPVAPVAV